MTSKGYTTAATVIAQLGRAITEEQQTHLEDVVIPAAEQWVDDTGARVYGESAVVGERLLMSSPYVWLEKTPVQTLTRVQGWYWGQSSDNIQTLSENYYSLIDPTNGQLYLPSWQQWAYLTADYTPDPTIPEKIALATAIVCCVYMRTVLHPAVEWTSEYSSGQDIRTKFRDLTIPEIVYDMIGSRSGEVFVV